MTTNNRITPRLIILLLVAWAMLSFRLGSPWFGVQDSFRVWVASSVRNYDIYGLENTGLMVTRNSAPVDPEDLIFYSHHPPLISWMPAIITQFTGFNELGVRYGFAAVTLIGIAVFYVFVRRLYGHRMAWWAAAFYSFVPMISYMQRVPGHDPLGLTAGLLFGAVLVNWLRQPTRSRLIALHGLAWLAMLSAWPGVFLVGGLGVGAMILGNRQQRIAVFGLGVSSVIAFVLLMGFYQLQWSESIESLLDAFVWRSSDATARSGSDSFTVIEFLSKASADLFVLATPGLFLLTFVGLPALIKHSSHKARILWLALFGAGITYNVVFRNASYIHDYYKAFLIPAMAMCAASAWVYIRMSKPKKRYWRPAVDGLMVASVIGGVGVFAILHMSGHQPTLQAVIHTVNETAKVEDKIAIHINYPGYTTDSGYNRVVEFYTFKNVEWDITPEEALALTPTNGGDILYTFCSDPDHKLSSDEQKAQGELELLADFEQEPVYEDRCTLFRITPSANSS